MTFRSARSFQLNRLSALRFNFQLECFTISWRRFVSRLVSKTDNKATATRAVMIEFERKSMKVTRRDELTERRL